MLKGQVAFLERRFFKAVTALVALAQTPFPLSLGDFPFWVLLSQGSQTVSRAGCGERWPLCSSPLLCSALSETGDLAAHSSRHQASSNLTPLSSSLLPRPQPGVCPGPPASSLLDIDALPLPVQIKPGSPPYTISSLSGSIKGHRVCTSRQYCLQGTQRWHSCWVTLKYSEHSQAL